METEGLGRGGDESRKQTSCHQLHAEDGLTPARSTAARQPHLWRPSLTVPRTGAHSARPQRDLPERASERVPLLLPPTVIGVQSRFVARPPRLAPGSGFWAPSLLSGHTESSPVAGPTVFLPSRLLLCRLLCSEHVCEGLLKHWLLRGVFPDFSSRIMTRPSLPPSAAGPQPPAQPKFLHALCGWGGCVGGWRGSLSGSFSLLW